MEANYAGRLLLLVMSFSRVISANATSERIGINQSLLAQYISGNKKPSPTQNTPCNFPELFFSILFLLLQ